MVLIVHEEDPLKDASGHVDGYVRAKAHRVYREAVHVLPDVETGAAPPILIKSLLQVRSKLSYPRVKLFDFWIFARIVTQVVLSPVKVKHELDQEVVHLNFALPEKFQQP